MPRIDKGLLLTFGPSLSIKAAETLAHTESVGVPAEPFIGFDASSSGIVTTLPYEADNPGAGYIIGPKSVNLYLGHVAMWRAALNMPGDHFLFMEDDVRFELGWKAEMESCHSGLPSDWDLCFLGSCCTGGRPKGNLHGRLWRVDFAMCLHAYMIHRKALKKMIEWCERVDGPIDAVIALRCIPHLVTTAYIPALAHQLGTDYPE